MYALKAFRFNALDYLVKPVDNDELVEAVAKATKKIKPTDQQLDQLQKQIRGQPITKIAIPSVNGVSFIDLANIIYGEASNNYSKLILTDGTTHLVSKNFERCAGSA